MARRIWTAEELEQLTAAERKAIFDASIARDLSEVDPAFLARVRGVAERLIEERDRQQAG